MNLVIPVRIVTERRRDPIARAQLYNLDDNQYFNFQFNPITLEPGREYGWSDEGWTGTDKIDTQFLGVGQTEIEVVSDWLVDPAAPGIQYHVGTALTYEDSAGNTRLIWIEKVIATVERWGQIRSDKRRSSLVRLIIGDNWYFNGRMTRFSARIDERFANGLIRRASLRIGFKEWKSPTTFTGGLGTLARTT